ncbi:NRDE family protein [Actinocatenispora sera]|uniref:Transport and Golgi organization protein 2 n=1 Tax=Actinocatenispora sera TaxID=390989 RepID=A0A810LAU3_9ACTN|nr:NRDE family protein [Actinocatenispora sera]BCJ31995.1 hypothetical protein Asera_61030 [Actinocatenispora sera]
MCTVLASLRPDADWPVLVLAVRDEMLGRPWQPPARHWPDRPRLLGGLDEQAGGTWLAVDPAAGRIACVLNASGRPADPVGRTSRGGLPLAAAAGEAAPAELTGYDPCHLLVIDGGVLCVTTWDGYEPHRYRLTAGDHLFVNQGRWLGPADRRSPRAAHFGPRFAAAERPEPAPGKPVADAWAPWLALLDGPDVPAPSDPRALLARSVQDDGTVWGTSSVTLLGLSATGELRYDFRPGAEAAAGWSPIETG